MKQLFISILLLFASQLPAQQVPEPCEAGDCYCIYESARKVWKAGMYELAVNKLNAWKTCDPDKVEYADDLIIDIFKEVDGLKKKAEAAKAEADSLLHKNEKIINAFYFYADRFALAFGKKDERNIYYYIVKNGDKVDKLGVWGKAEQFNETGFAKVGFKEITGMRDYLLDTLGNTYPVAYNINDLSDTITALDLSENDFVSIPEIVLKQIQFKVLMLYGNQLSSLPDRIGELKNLTLLSLSGNKLSSLPERIGELKNLTLLDLANNQLSSLPESIGELKNLTSLDLANSQLSSLPKFIGELKNLTSLNLRRNHLSSLPESIGELKSLKSLYLGGNQLDSLPERIGELKSLTKLGLGDNNLSSLPESIRELKILTLLNLSGNKLSSLPQSIGELKSLTSLYLSGNPLPPSEIEKLRAALPNCKIIFE